MNIEGNTEVEKNSKTLETYKSLTENSGVKL